MSFSEHPPQAFSDAPPAMASEPAVGMPPALTPPTVPPPEGLTSTPRMGLWRKVFRWPVFLRGLEALLLLAMALVILQDRIALGREFLFLYSDEDQTLLWLSASDLLHGHIPEPCFYGQAFSSCLEGYLAAPLLKAGVAPWTALPAVTMALGLFPFLAMAWSAWRRHRPALAALSLLIPLALPVRYAMITGMPRGFVTGIAIAIIPCLLLLDPLLPPIPSLKPRPWRNSLRFFFVGLLAVIALTVNPNCSLLLAGALAYALATRLRQAAFWLYASLGAMIGAVYPVSIFFFYYKLHDDYRLYHRQGQLDWSSYDFHQFYNHLAIPLHDFLPVGLTASATAWAVGMCFGAVLFSLLLRRRWAAALATLAAVGFGLYSLGFKRVHEGRSSVFFPYARMYLAVPVLPMLLLLWGSVRQLFSGSVVTAPAGKPRTGGAIRMWIARANISSWIPRVLLVAFFGLSILATRDHTRQMPAVIASELGDVQVLQLIDVAEAWDIAHAVQLAADAQDTHVVLLVGNQKRWAYLLPVLTDCQTLYPNYERRTWRLVEESFPQHKRILVMDRALFDKASRGGYPHAKVIQQTPFIGVFDTKGQSLVRICQDLSVNIRAYRVPEGADVLR